MYPQPLISARILALASEMQVCHFQTEALRAMFSLLPPSMISGMLVKMHLPTGSPNVHNEHSAHTNP